MMIASFFYLVIAGVVALLVMIIPLLWLVVLWRYAQAGHGLKGVLQLLKTVGICLAIGLAVFVGLELWSKYWGDGAEESAKYNLVYILSTIIFIFICPLAFILRGMDAYEEAGELVQEKATTAKSLDILDD